MDNDENAAANNRLVSLVLSIPFLILYVRAVMEDGTCFALKQADGTWTVSPTDPALATIPVLGATDFGSKLMSFSILSLVFFCLNLAFTYAPVVIKNPNPSMILCASATLVFGLTYQFVWNLILGFNDGVQACQPYVPASYLAMIVNWWFNMIMLGLLGFVCLGMCCFWYSTMRAIERIPADAFKAP